MSEQNKQIYISKINISGSFVEEIGGGLDRIMYPGASFDISLTAEDFNNTEEYHNIWISITRAVKSKLNKHATS